MYTVFGYDDMCREFKLTFDSFVLAIKRFAALENDCVCFMRRSKPGDCLSASFAHRLRK